LFKKNHLTQKSEAHRSLPPPTSGSVTTLTRSSKELVDTDFRGDYIAASADHRRKTVGPVVPVLVFEIVDLERETQAAVS